MTHEPFRKYLLSVLVVWLPLGGNLDYADYIVGVIRVRRIVPTASIGWRDCRSDLSMRPDCIGTRKTDHWIARIMCVFVRFDPICCIRCKPAWLTHVGLLCWAVYLYSDAGVDRGAGDPFDSYGFWSNSRTTL